MCVRACAAEWLSSYALGLAGNFPILQHLPTPVHPAVIGTWNFWGANSLAMACQSAKGSGGTSGAHTHKLRVLVSPPVGS